MASGAGAIRLIGDRPFNVQLALAGRCYADARRYSGAGRRKHSGADVFRLVGIPDNTLAIGNADLIHSGLTAYVGDRALNGVTVITQHVVARAALDQVADRIRFL